MKIRPVEAEFHVDGQTDMTKLKPGLDGAWLVQ
jgi:hypothetical protein